MGSKIEIAVEDAWRSLEGKTIEENPRETQAKSSFGSVNEIDRAIVNVDR